MIGFAHNLYLVLPLSYLGYNLLLLLILLLFVNIKNSQNERFRSFRLDGKLCLVRCLMICIFRKLTLFNRCHFLLESPIVTMQPFLHAMNIRLNLNLLNNIHIRLRLLFFFFFSSIFYIYFYIYICFFFFFFKLHSISIY